MTTPTLETYKRMLVIDKFALDDELMMQADVLQQIGEVMSELEQHVAELSDTVKQAEAAAFSAFKAAGDSDKLSEQRAKTDPSRAAALSALQDAKRAHGQWQNLYESWKAKGYSLAHMTALFQASYFSNNRGAGVDRAERPKPLRDYTREPAVAKQERRRIT